ncbi:hypothetical protein RUM43_001910 [Polyplax serrata]|uniref:Genetic suppressor element-like domain-containing protein n=1 Tax=Polyplax serrata TaxID=468196 RepID=A0AAN8SF47_POLSC
MDLTESMKNLVGKGLLGDMGPPSSGGGFAGTGYVTEKLYMLLQLYLQNKGWNPSVELLQCFSELKEASMLPSAAYLQMMAQRVTLDSQGRLVLRENGKIILPFEHFGNAVMLKHMNGPQGMHLGLEATIRAVMDSYTIGREQFGMEKEFIIDIVQNCPNGACRYYKSQLELSHRNLAHISGGPPYIDPQPSKKGKSSSSRDNDQRNSQFGNDDYNLSHHSQSAVDLTPNEKPSKSNSTSAQSRLFENFQVAQLLSAVQQMVGNEAKSSSLSKSSKSHHIEPSAQDHKIAEFLRANLENLEGLGLTSSNKDLLALHNGAWGGHENENKRLSAAAGEVGQEKIIRAFTEIMKNMARMKTCIRPAMCKPYGKQSESLQKTLMDTVQLVQSLRQVLPPPHIAVSSWKNEDKHGTGKQAYLQHAVAAVAKYPDLQSFEFKAPAGDVSIRPADSCENHSEFRGGYKKD